MRLNDDEAKRRLCASKRCNLTALAVLAVLAAAAVLLFAFYHRPHTFTPGRWRDAPETRLEIADDLLARYALVGMREAEVLALLGPEDSAQTTFKISRRTFPADTTLVYSLGVDYMDNVWLILPLRDGVVCEYLTDVS